MDPERAVEAVGWLYPAPYDLYNVSPRDAADAAVFMAEAGSGYHAILNEVGEFIGFVCYGEEARVPGGDYRPEALDVGCGLHPHLTGQGLGPKVIRAALRFGRERLGARRFRATVAAFNLRAQRATARAGFRESARFERPSDGLQFVVFELEI